MVGWITGIVDRIAGALVRRGQSLVDAENRALEEQRSAIRDVRNLVTEAMSEANTDRDQGSPNHLMYATTAANKAAAIVQEVDDQEARDLVGRWKGQFDGIPKGWKSGEPIRGYPDLRWKQLKTSADEAVERLGTLLREASPKSKAP